MARRVITRSISLWTNHLIMMCCISCNLFSICLSVSFFVSLWSLAVSFVLSAVPGAFRGFADSIRVSKHWPPRRLIFWTGCHICELFFFCFDPSVLNGPGHSEPVLSQTQVSTDTRGRDRKRQRHKVHTTQIQRVHRRDTARVQEIQRSRETDTETDTETDR